MRQIFIMLLLLILITGCFKVREDSNDYYAEKILAEQVDSQGRLIKKVVTGRIPGEGTYLTIAKYDTIGKLIEEYGALPYGKKYRTTYTYNAENQVIEESHYTFFSGNFDTFEKYQGDELYQLLDTAVSYDGVIDYKILFTYNNHDSLVFEHSYYAYHDSLTKKVTFKFHRVDTINNKGKSRY